MVSIPGQLAKADSIDPSGPIVGPETRWGSTPCFSRRPKTVATVFSWAPPMTRRVIIWVTRIAEGSARTGLQFRKPRADEVGLFHVARGGIRQVKLIIEDGGIGI